MRTFTVDVAKRKDPADPPVFQVVTHPELNDLGQMLGALGLGRRGKAHRADDDVDNLVEVTR